VGPGVPRSTVFGTLKWDGSDLGKLSSDKLRFCSMAGFLRKKGSSACPPMFCVLDINKCAVPCILFKDARGGSKNFASLVDQIKPLFGLENHGSHIVTLRQGMSRIDSKGSWMNDNVKVVTRSTRYVMYNTPYVVKKRMLIFLRDIPLTEVAWIPMTTNDITDMNSSFFHQVQSLLVFRKMLRLPTSLSDIFVRKSRTGAATPVCYSGNITGHDIDKNTEQKWLSAESRQLLFGRSTSVPKAITGMITGDPKSPPTRVQISTLKRKIVKVIESVSPSFAYITSSIVTFVRDNQMCDI
jgi:hypothetical protein